MVQVVEYLPSKSEALSSNPTTAKKGRKGEGEREKKRGKEGRKEGRKEEKTGVIG
jgi:hypothetical protein